MALSIGVRRGKKILIGGTHLLTVREIVAPNQVRVAIDGREILVTEKERVQLLPDVYVSCGLDADAPDDQYSRLAFEAPRSIRIERVRPPQKDAHRAG